MASALIHEIQARAAQIKEMLAAIEIRKAEAINRCAENLPATALLAEAETSMQSEHGTAIADATEIEQAKETAMVSETAGMAKKAEEKAPEVETEKEVVTEAEAAIEVEWEIETEIVKAAEIRVLPQEESEAQLQGESLANTKSPVRGKSKS